MKLSNRLALLALLLLLPLVLCAQKKQIQTARDQVKSGKDLAKAVASMQGLLSDSANRQNPRIWLVLCDALKAQYEQSNERLYLKQATDTTTIFSLTMRLFETLSAFDSLDVRPDSKGRVRAEHRERHAAFLHSIRPNLFNGGVFYTRKRQYAEAYRFYETYIQSQDWPIFTGYDYADRDPLLPTGRCTVATNWGWRIRSSATRTWRSATRACSTSCGSIRPRPTCSRGTRRAMWRPFGTVSTAIPTSPSSIRG